MNIILFTFFMVVGLFACSHQKQSETIANYVDYIDNKGLTLAKRIEPFEIKIKYLPDKYLRLLQESESLPAAANTKQQTLTFQVVLQSTTSGEDVQTLIRRTAPAGMRAEEQQNKLFYHLDEVAYINNGRTKTLPLFATQEVAAQSSQAISLLFVFPATAINIQQPVVYFTLENTFFLPEPVTFAFKTADISAVMP
jgi:hypothetical protein